MHLSLLGTATHSDLPARSTLRRWVHRALNVDAQVTLVFVGARAGRRLNRQFRRRDYATNVLTFGYQTRPIVVADIVICLPIVRREARQQGKTLREHLAHMVVHGALHALGHDHARRRDAQKMQLLERRLLAQLRIPDPYA
ncbi:MAG TPA: rRNA maturation RNase YbeY [Burkholderiaceae bacterium]|nr:rRNA maturation RNase YbeY [Burkholderiaceae bacterium]